MFYFTLLCVDLTSAKTNGNDDYQKQFCFPGFFFKDSPIFPGYLVNVSCATAALSVFFLLRFITFMILVLFVLHLQLHLHLFLPLFITL